MARNSCFKEYMKLPADTRKKILMRRDGLIIDGNLIFRPKLCETNENGVVFAGKSIDGRSAIIYLFIPRKVGRMVMFSLKKFAMEINAFRAVLSGSKYKINEKAIETISSLDDIEVVDGNIIRVRIGDGKVEAKVVFADEIEPGLYGMTASVPEKNMIIEVLCTSDCREYKINKTVMPVPFEKLKIAIGD